MSVEAKSGNLVLSDISLPERVEPGEEAVARVSVENLATIINMWDDDRCIAGGTPVGYRYRVQLRVDGETYESGESCLEKVIGDNHEQREITFEAPSSAGTTEVKARLELSESGERSDWLSRRLEVYGPEDDAPVGAPVGGGSSGVSGWFDDGGSGGSGASGGGGSAAFGNLNVVIGLIVLLAGFYAAGQLFDINLGGA